VHTYACHSCESEAALHIENTGQQMHFNMLVAHLLGANRITRLVPGPGIHELHATLDCAACDP